MKHVNWNMHQRFRRNTKMSSSLASTASSKKKKKYLIQKAATGLGRTVEFKAQQYNDMSSGKWA